MEQVGKSGGPWNIADFYIPVASTAITIIGIFWTTQSFWRSIIIGIIFVSMIVVYELHRRHTNQQRDFLMKQNQDMAREILKLAIEIALRDNVLGKLPNSLNGRAAIWMMVESTKKLVLKYEHGMQGAKDGELQFKSRQGWIGAVWHNKKPIIYDLSQDQNKVQSRWFLNDGEFDVIKDEGVLSGFCVPIFHSSNRDEVIGVLSIDCKEQLSGTPFNTNTFEDEITKIANHLGQLLARGQTIK